MNLTTGDRVCGYVLVERIASGRHEVWAAAPVVRDGTCVAIKIRSTEGAVAGPDLDHANIIRTIAHDPPNTVMEFVEGRSLRQFMGDQGLIAPPYAIDIAVQVLEALAYIHSRKLFHKAINPDHILVERKRVLVAPHLKANFHYVKITAPGDGGETAVRYLAPEQAQARSIDARADLFSVGVVLYEMLTGGPPAGMEYPSELNPVVTKELDAICKKALATDPGRRYSSAAEMIEALKQAKASFVSAAPRVVAPEPPKPTDPPPVPPSAIEPKVVRAPHAAVKLALGCLSVAPWWLVSTGIHIVLLLAAMLIYVEREMRVDDREFAVSMATSAGLNDIDRPRDIFERKGIPTDDAMTSDDVAIFFPDARASNRNESADDEDYRQMKGDSKDYLSHRNGEGGGFRGGQNSKDRGAYDTMGVGGGGGGSGRYGGRFGGRENLVTRGGGTRATEGAVLAALLWLARHQMADGSWGTYQCACAADRGGQFADYNVGLTGLSLLAFLGAGYSHLSKDEVRDPVDSKRTFKFGEVCRNAEKWLMAQQSVDGLVGRGDMYSHAIAALALSETYGMTNAELIKAPAQKAMDYLVAAQTRGSGWRYTANCGSSDSSVTGWCCMALKSAELSELTFPAKSYRDALAWYDQVTDRSGCTGYVSRASRQGGHPTMTAVAVMCRLFLKKLKDDPSTGGAGLVAADPPKWGMGVTDFYYWYNGSLALFQFDGPDGALWQKWNEPMKNALLPNQKGHREGCGSGSWSAKEDRYAVGGRIYTTALGALTLEVYYRYQSVFGARK